MLVALHNVGEAFNIGTAVMVVPVDDLPELLGCDGITRCEVCGRPVPDEDVVYQGEDAYFCPTCAKEGE